MSILIILLFAINIVAYIQSRAATIGFTSKWVVLNEVKDQWLAALDANDRDLAQQKNMAWLLLYESRV